MLTRKPAKIRLTGKTGTQAVAAAVADSTGKLVRAVESLLGTDATKSALEKAGKQILQRAQYFEARMDEMKKGKDKAADVTAESIRPKLG